MANRAYLYTASADHKVLRDVSENRSDIPLLYRILLSAGTRNVDSRIWDFDQPIAISGDMAAGIQRYYDLLDYLGTQGLPKETLQAYRASTEEFFAKHPDRVLERFFMEPGEVYDLYGVEDLGRENAYEVSKIMKMGELLEKLLAERPTLTQENTPSWLTDAMENIAELEPYWTHVTYFSFNKS